MIHIPPFMFILMMHVATGSGFAWMPYFDSGAFMTKSQCEDRKWTIEHDPLEYKVNGFFLQLKCVRYRQEAEE